MPKTLIGLYESREDARAIRDRLLANGISADRIRTHWRDGDAVNRNEPLPEDRGLAGFIGRMFSGLTGETASIEKYEAHARRGGALVFVELPDNWTRTYPTRSPTRGPRWT